VDKDKQKLLSLVDNFSGKRIAVWGDFILDEYVFGRTRRISREAPVLILTYQKKEFALGGAGNAVLNLQTLGACPLPVGVVGIDAPGETIIEILHNLKITTRFLFRLKGYPTPIKTRILAGEENTRKQQILRIDSDFRVPENRRLNQRVNRYLKLAQNLCSALLISDYNYLTVKKDIFDEIIPGYRKAKCPVTLDSRFRLLTFHPVSAATPNEPEVEAALNLDIGESVAVLKRAGNFLLKRLRSPALLITRGSRGMALFERGKPPFLMPVRGTTDIVDVTGAGDTVISVFTLALACGAAFRQAAELANYAGGIVVMKKGTATLTAGELREAVSS
jgi:rfaE bifunctional protein kinase chain/domain